MTDRRIRTHGGWQNNNCYTVGDDLYYPVSTQHNMDAAILNALEVADVLA
jgi:hypothetical protein